MFCLSQLLLFMVVGGRRQLYQNGDGGVCHFVPWFAMAALQRTAMASGEFALCLAAPAGVYQGWPCGGSPSSSGWAGGHGAAGVESESWAGRGSWRAAFSCVLCRHSAKNTGCESPIKALKSPKHRLWESSESLKEPQVELLKYLVSPSLPWGADSQTKRVESLSRSYWQQLHYAFLTHTNNNKKIPWNHVNFGGSYGSQEIVALLIFLNMDTVFELAGFCHALRNR